FPVGKQRAMQLRREKSNLIEQALRVGGVGRDDGSEPVLLLFALAEARQQQRVGGTHGAGQGKALAGKKFRKFHEKCKTPRAAAGEGCNTILEWSQTDMSDGTNNLRFFALIPCAGHGTRAGTAGP